MQFLGCSHLIPKTNYLPTHTQYTMVEQDRRIAITIPNQKKERIGGTWQSLVIAILKPTTYMLSRFPTMDIGNAFWLGSSSTP